MYLVQHLVPNSFNINLVRISARWSQGFYQPCSQNLGVSPRWFYQSCIQYIIQSPMVLKFMQSESERQSMGFYQPCSQNLRVQSSIQYLIQSPMGLLFRTSVLVSAGFTSPVMRTSLLVLGVFTSPVVRTSVLVTGLFSSPVVRTSVLVLEGCIRHEFSTPFGPNGFTIQVVRI